MACCIYYNELANSSREIELCIILDDHQCKILAWDYELSTDPGS